MSRPQVWHKVLLQEAQRRGIDLSSLDVENLDAQSASRVAAWVNHNLVDQEPLTSEELAIWQYLSQAGSKTRQAAAQDEVPSTLLRETDFERAIQELEISTQNLEANSKVLERQKQVASRLSGRLAGNDKTNVSFEHDVQRRQAAEKQQLYFMKNEVESELQAAIQSTNEKVEKSLKMIKPTVNQKLRADDRVLDSANASAPSDTLEMFLQQSLIQQKVELLKRATTYSIKARLDRIYLERLGAHTSESTGRGNSAEVQQTHNSLQSLYTEIEDIASMLVDHEHGARLRSMENDIQSIATEEKTRFKRDIIDKITALTSTAEELARRYRLLQAHREANNHFHKLFLHTDNATMLKFTRPEDRQETHTPPGLTALLRQLNIDDGERLPHPDHSRSMHEASFTITDKNQGCLDRIVKDSRHSAHEGSRHFDQLAAASNHHFDAAKSQSGDLDLRIASAKARLEKASGIK